MIDNKSPVTLYYQVERQIRQSIENGVWKPGDIFPGDKELIDIFKVSRITIRKALERLEEDGLIIKRRGARTIVANYIPRYSSNKTTVENFRGIEDELRQKGLSPRAKLLEQIKIAPPREIQEIFHINEDTELIRIRRICDMKEDAIWMESRYFPVAIGEQLDQQSLENESILQLMNNLGISISHVEIQLEAVSATPTQAKLLKIPRMSPLLLHQSISFSETNEVLQLSRAYLRGDYYKFLMHAKPQPAGIPGLDIISGGYVLGKNK